MLLASAIDLINNYIALPTVVRGLAARGLVLGQPALIASVLLVPAVGVACWYFIARRRSVIAKWVLAAFVALSVIIFFRQMSVTPLTTVTPMLIAAIAAQLLRLLAVICLFMPSAQPWFQKEHVE